MVVDGGMNSDLTKVRQNLFNLISNAAKFTENGTIALYAHRESRDAKDWLVFKVTGTGIGIPEEKLAYSGMIRPPVPITSAHPFRSAAPRCTAHSKRSGQPCKAPAVRGWRVCRMHGAGGGHEAGDANPAHRHGLRTREWVEIRRAISELARV
jgi:hypothetical protein